MAIKLKPCPFCGGEARIEKFTSKTNGFNDTTWSVNCMECDIGTIFDSDKKDMILKWNTRKEVKDEVS
jgi:Lar family restriction alleviation protein